MPRKGVNCPNANFVMYAPSPHVNKATQHVSMLFKKGLNLTAWERELHNDYDKEFLLNGIKSGFDIIDPKASPTSVELSNHPSARASNPLYKKATDQNLEELRKGNYVHAPSPPVIVSPLGVIP